ncbi:MAG TPA: hypothetical protein VI564_03435 [Candidatus Nanoarchaeia archaeon]|nr:hypothetical protein [Candidatus Nanoarchaeia archaeon]
MVILYEGYPLEKETAFGLLKIKPSEAYSGCKKELNGLELVVINPIGIVELVVNGKKEKLVKSEINRNNVCEVMGIHYSDIGIWYSKE